MSSRSIAPPPRASTTPSPLPVSRLLRVRGRERRLTVAREDIRDGGACLGFDHVVDVNELPAQALSDNRTDGRFARAHEAGENDAARRCRDLWPCLIS